MTDAESRHPEDHVMAAFVDGTLGAAEVVAVAQHLRGCADCRTVVSETARLERETEPAARAGGRWWWLAAAAVVVLVSTLVLRWHASRGASVEHLIAAAPREHRYLEARLSGFDWARLQAPVRGRVAPDPADLKLLGAAGDVLDRTADAQTAEANHARGVAHLLSGAAGDAITTLERAANDDAGNAKVWNDLAAARYSVAVSEERPSLLPSALAAADRALALDAKFAAAHFNRALILERIGLRDEARRQWQKYLDLEPANGWSVEAQDHLRRLQQPQASFDRKLFETLTADALVRQFPQEARTWGEAPLLAEWAAAETKHDAAGAQKKLALVRALGAALAAFKGEHLLADAVAAIDRATADARASLAEAQLTYDAARRLYGRSDPGEAERRFRQAADLFRRAGSPMAKVATYYAAAAAFDQHRGVAARDALGGLLSTIDRKRHRALDAQIQWQLAVIDNTDGDFGSGLRSAEAAAAIFRDLGERFNAAFVDCIAAHSFDMIGASDAAWSRRTRGFPTLAANRSMFDATLHSAAETMGMLGQTGGARALLDVVIADEADFPAQQAAAFTSRARLEERAGDRAAGLRSVADARTAANGVKDPALREMLAAQTDLAEAALRTEREPRAAIATLDRSIAFFAGGRLGKLLPDAYLHRARAFRAAGDETSAAADYASAFRAIEEQRDSIGDAELRLRFLDVASQIVEGSIELSLSAGRAAKAFAFADRTRALFDRGAIAGPGPRVPPGLLVVEYAVLPRSIVIFSATAEGVGATKMAIERRVLAERVDSFARKIRSRAPDVAIQEDGAALYELLIAPLRPQLAAYENVVLIPDRELHAVPFAALYDAANKRYLADQLTIRLVPSAAAAPAPAGTELRPALVVADPAAAGWPRLPASGEEAVSIAAAYDTTPLRGENATRAAFVEAATNSAMIHFAGHADSDVHRSYGALLLATTAGDSGVLGAGDIARLALPGRPLVVLAACGTFRGSASHVAGMPSLARSFLLAGARGVIGTLWEIDDDVSAPLFLRIHDHLRAGAVPARAVRAAQVEMIHASDARLRHPATWAPVTFLSSSL